MSVEGTPMTQQEIEGVIQEVALSAQRTIRTRLAEHYAAQGISLSDLDPEYLAGRVEALTELAEAQMMIGVDDAALEGST